jgi:hypothetical protein
MATHVDPNKVVDRAEQMARTGLQKLERGTTRARDGIDAATTRVGRSVVSAGEAVESAGRSAGQKLVSAGQYMQDSDPTTMRNDIMEVFRRHPGATLGVGIAAGVAIGYLLTPRR